MYNGKHMKDSKPSKKALVLLTALLLIFTVGVGSTLAYLVTKTEPVVNTFQPSIMEGSIDEGFDGITKTDVTVKNTGDVPAYVRAAIIINWVDEDGNVVTEPVAAGDYNISLNEGEGKDWIQLSDGYYYYKSVVPAKTNEEPGTTTNLINSCSVTSDGSKKGYHLSVEILAQAVQAEPEQAVKEVWGVNSSDFIHEEN